MPRAFLITHRRYNGAEAEFDGSRGDYSPERGVRLAEYGAVHPTSDGASECGSETSSECPEELYNLTKLAEVSLAAAAGTLIHPSNIVYQRSASPRCTDLLDKCTVKNTNSRAKQHPPQQHQGTFQYEHQYQQQHQQEQQHEEPIHSQEPLRTGDYEEERKILGERTRLFFERIESEREILELQTERNAVLEVRLSSPQHHRHHHRHYHSQHHHHHHPHHSPAVVAVAPHRLQHQQENKEEEKEKRDAIARVQLPPDNNRVAEAIKAEQSSTTSTTRIVAVSPLPPQPPLPPKAVQQHATTESTKTTTEDNEDHECPDCGKKYSTSSNLARHRQTHRSLGDKKARRCPHCDKLYVSMPAFSMHVRTHNQGCKCHYCGKCFSRPWLLQGHIRTHTGEKPFKCTICNKAFADKSNLRAHIQTHSNTKPHVCGRCGKAFALKSYLYKHEESSCMRAHHRSSTTEKNESTEGQKTKAKGNSSSSSSTINSTQSITTTTTTSTTLTTARVTASPTSVIVPRLGLDRDRNSSSAFSAIIRHTGASDASSVHPPSKRPCKEPTTTTTTTKTTTTTEAATTSMASSSQDRERRKTEECPRDSEIVSNMVIRTSVISPNPERLGRFCNDIAKKPTSNFDYNDATRTSDFSRPTTMTLNLAIA